MLDLTLFISHLEKMKASVVAAKILNVDNTGISLKQKHFIISLIKAYEQSAKVNDDLVAKKFLQDHNAILNTLFIVLNNNKNKETYELLKNNYDYMKTHDMPFNLKQLKVNGTVLKEEFKDLENKLIGKMLNKALKFCLSSPNNNTKAKILNFLKEEFSEGKTLW